MKNIYILSLILSSALFGCAEKPIDKDLLLGNWLGELQIEPETVPFQFTFSKSGEKWQMEVYNAEEILLFDEVQFTADSVIIPMGIFDASIRVKLNDTLLEGSFKKHYTTGYSVPFSAKKGNHQRFETKKDASADFTGKWKTTFQKSDGSSYDAIGIFKQNDNLITGTFLTELGDYRYLEGNVEQDKFQMSAFDGSHVYYFSGEMLNGEITSGIFRSGPTGKEVFQASLDPNFELADSHSFNFLKEGYENFTFSFPNTAGDTISLADSKFQDKVVLVQLFGSWCPNCMDETKYLAEKYPSYQKSGVEVIALSFESKPDFAYASQRVKRAQDKLDADYTFLIAGTSKKEEASQALPALNQVIAFPTLIYLDKKGEVRKIHTGFSGPGTGKYYEDWQKEHEAYLVELLAE